MAQNITQLITLPSRGLLYGGQIPEGKCSIRKMLMEEVSILESGGSGTERIDKLLEACLTLPGNFAKKDLLITDRFAALIAIRNFTFPLGTYPIVFKCQYCGEVNRVQFDLINDLTVKLAGGDAGEVPLQEPVLVELPDCGAKLELRFLRGSDEDAVVKYAKRIKMQTNDAKDPSSKHRLARQILTIDGQKPANLIVAEEWVAKQTARDILKMRKVVDDAETGVDTTFLLDCKACQMTNKVEMPFTGEFFRPEDL